MLPGHQRTNNITPGKLSQPSYLTEIQIQLVSWYLRLRIPEKKRCNTNWRDDNVRSSRNELWKRVPKQEFIIKPRRGWGGGWWTHRPFIEISKKMDFHNHVNKETITIGPPARCARHDITLPGHMKTNIITLGKWVPTIIFDQDPYLIGVRTPQTQDAWEEKVRHKLNEMIL